MRRPSDRDRELSALAYDHAGLRIRVSVLRLQLALERRYDPNQPRWPAGQREGGRWSPGGGGTGKPGGRNGRLLLSDTVDADGNAIASAINRGDRDYDWDERDVVVAPDGTSTVFETKDRTQTIRDGETGEMLSRSTWGPNGPETKAVRQDAQLRLRLPAAPPGPWPVAAAGAVYGALSNATTSIKGILGLGFTAREFERGTVSGEANWVGYVDRDEVSGACPRYRDVQRWTDEAAAKVDREGRYSDEGGRGTKIHIEVRDIVRVEDNPDLKAERSLSKTTADVVYYSQLGSVRIDVFEHAKNGTTCVYDIKTGRAGFPLGRMTDLAQAVYRNFPDTQRILVIQVKPNQ